MRAKLTTGFGYTLLTSPAIAGVVNGQSPISLPNIIQFAVFGAGAIALLLMTHTSPAR